MQCISIKEPWASMTLKEIKPVENRNWSTSYRGPLLIHVSKTWDEEGAKFITKNYPEFRHVVDESRGRRGEILGSVNMVDCVTKHSSEWFFGPYGFVFTEPKFFAKSIPYKGQLGIFIVLDFLVE
jgi:hypothetical protein